MVTKVGLDFSSSIKQIEELKSAAEAFGRVIQDVLSTSSRFGNIVNQSMAGVNQASMASTPQPFAGTNADLIGNVRDKLQSNQQQVNDFFRAHPGAQDVGSGRYKYRTPNGTQFKNLNPLFTEQKELKRQEEDLVRADSEAARVAGQKGLGEQIKSTVESRQAVDKFKTGTNHNFSTLGYSMSDLPGVLSASSKLNDGQGGDLKRLSDTIKGLSDSGNRNSMIAADVLKEISNSLRGAQGEFTKALEEFAHPDTKASPEKQKVATDRLIDTMARLDQTISQAKDAQRGAKDLPGAQEGDGGGGSGGIFGISAGGAKKFGSGLLALAGAGVGAYKFYQEASIGLGKAVVGGQFDKIINQGQFAEMRYKDVAASQNMTDVENIFRYRGDALLGNRQQYLGASGMQNALKISGEKQRQEIDLMRRERDRDVFGAKAGIGLSALQIAGGTAAAIFGGPAGMVIGGSAIMSGIGGVVNGVKSLTGAYTQSPYSQLTGELDTGISGMIGRTAFGPQFSYNVQNKQQALQENLKIKQYADARQIQDAEMQKLRPLMAGYQEIMNTIEVQQEGAISVGRYAQRGRDNISRRASHYMDPARHFVEAQTQHTQIRVSQENKARDDFNSAGRDIFDSELKQVIMNIESSGGNINAKNPDSTAAGPFGMTKPTANALGKRIGISNAYDRLTNGSDPEKRIIAAQLWPEHLKDLHNAADQQRKLGGTATMIPRQMLSALNQLGPADVTKYLQTGIDYTPKREIPRYINNLSKQFDIDISGFNTAINGLRGIGIQNTALKGFNVPGVASEDSVINYGATRGLSINAQLEMSSADFDRHQNQVTGVLGGPRSASDAQTSRLIKMGRSGLGDFGSLLGNVSGLNRAIGGTDNIGKLEQVLANAVSAGFDKSRTAQAFTQSVTQIAEQAGVSNVDGVAGTLRVASSGMAVGGVADEKSLARATTALGQYSAYTSQRGNMSGLVGTIASMQAGITFGKGAGILGSMSNPEISDAILQLTSGKITDPKLDSLLRVAGVDAHNKDARDVFKNKLINVSNAKSAPLKQMLMQRGGLDIDSAVAKLGTPGTKGFSEGVANIIAKAREAGHGSDTGEGGMVGFVSDEIRKGKAEKGKADMNQAQITAIINKTIASSPFTDTAKQQFKAFNDSLVANINVQDRFGAKGTVSAEERDLYFKSLGAGGQTAVIKKGTFEGKAITQESYDAGSKEFKNQADETLKGMSRLDLVRSTNYAAAIQNQNVQQVYVMNFNEMLAINLRSNEVITDKNK